jgi:hypothetical protein
MKLEMRGVPTQRHFITFTTHILGATSCRWVVSNDARTIHLSHTSLRMNPLRAVPATILTTYAKPQLPSFLLLPYP